MSHGGEYAVLLIIHSFKYLYICLNTTRQLQKYLYTTPHLSIKYYMLIRTSVTLQVSFPISFKYRKYNAYNAVGSLKRLRYIIYITIKYK